MFFPAGSGVTVCGKQAVVWKVGNAQEGEALSVHLLTPQSGTLLGQLCFLAPYKENTDAGPRGSRF